MSDSVINWDDMNDDQRCAIVATVVEQRPFRKPSHGTCCTCQTCGEAHENCRCGVAYEVDKALEVIRPLLGDIRLNIRIHPSFSVVKIRDFRTTSLPVRGPYPRTDFVVISRQNHHDDPAWKSNEYLAEALCVAMLRVMGKRVIFKGTEDGD